MITSSELFGKKIVGCGDSVMAGAGFAWGTTGNWFHLLCAHVGATEINTAIAGTSLETGLATTPFNLANVPTYDSSYGAVFMAYGINDIENAGNLAAFQTAMANATTAIIAKGWSLNQIIWISVYFYSSFHGISDSTKAIWVEGQRVKAAELDNGFIDVYTSFAARADRLDYMAESYHPNQAGHMIIESTVYDALQPSVITIKGRRAIVQ